MTGSQNLLSFRTGSAIWRLAVWAALFALAGGWLAEPFHFLVKHHQWCPEHQRFEHGSGFDAGAALKKWVLPRDGQAAGFLAAVPRQESGAHEFCTILACARSTLQLAVQDSPSAVSPENPNPLPRGTAVRRSWIPVILLAPKNSPPPAPEIV